MLTFKAVYLNCRQRISELVKHFVVERTFFNELLLKSTWISILKMNTDIRMIKFCRYVWSSNSYAAYYTKKYLFWEEAIPSIVDVFSKKKLIETEKIYLTYLFLFFFYQARRQRLYKTNRVRKTAFPSSFRIVCDWCLLFPF